MSGRARLLAGTGALALGLALAGGADAAVISFMPNMALTSTPFAVSFGNGVAGYAFTSAATGNGPGAAVATSGTATVSSFFGAITDFGVGATINQTSQLYGFSAFPTAAVIPFSAANDYIGLAFTLTDGLHYGYAQVAGPRLVSYAFESTPGATILTGAVAAVPEPASLALFLVGVAGVAANRRRTHTQAGRT